MVRDMEEKLITTAFYNLVRGRGALGPSGEVCGIVLTDTSLFSLYVGVKAVKWVRQSTERCWNLQQWM